MVFAARPRVAEDGQVSAVYLSGLRLAGRRVVVLGAGRVAERRVPALLAAGAVINVVAPQARPALAELARRGDLVWERRAYRIGDLAGAWYVLVATDDGVANRAASVEAERQRTFCVRADQAAAATAWTPATAEVEGVLVGVVAGGNPRRSASLRDLLADTLRRMRRRAA
jgi:uroporphyrin-III C-methyltransferase/precorrin-2 dehydrogenase/sirohydrochlorin ferrochelatase